jgi:hypothetical protein
MTLLITGICSSITLFNKKGGVKGCASIGEKKNVQKPSQSSMFNFGEEK